MTEMRPKVTVYVTCHNYGRFLQRAIDSILSQNMTSWEMLLINDGSTDDTQEIADRAAALHPQQIRAVHLPKTCGLRYCANLALREAKGEYIIRLDADDYLDESAFLILSRYLDEHPDVALVYPNFIFVDEDDTYLGIENRKKIGFETDILDLPAHGACTMGRKRMLKSLGGYREEFQAQDGHEMWMQVLHRYKVANVSTPLFYYRQHPSSMTRNTDKVLHARQLITRAMAQRTEGRVRPRVSAVIPAKNTYDTMPNKVLTPFAGKPLIDYTIKAAIAAEAFDDILVTSDDPSVLDYTSRFSNLKTYLRSLDLSQNHVKMSQVMYDAVKHLEGDFGVFPDIVVMLNVHCPLRLAEDIRSAIDTLLVYDVDSVVSVYEDLKVHFKHGESGMKPLNPGMMNQLRLEREALYVDNGAIRAVWRDMITEKDFLGRKFGHIVMPWERSFTVAGQFQAWIVEQILAGKAVTAGLQAPKATAGS